MTNESWRIVKTKHTPTAFDGEGASFGGGRWNSPGQRMVYTSATASLAVLETLVHLEASSILPSYSLFRALFAEEMVEALEHGRLPADWRVEPAPASTRRLGDEWLRSRRSAVLRVPSVIGPHESNFLLNPEHDEFGSIRLDDPLPFSLDSRLTRR